VNTLNETIDVAVVGGGPAGLMAAEAALAGRARVAVFDAMPSVGRKFLLRRQGRAQPHPQRAAAGLPAAL
jgi:predicted flavoprotein YhiN